LESGQIGGAVVHDSLGRHIVDAKVSGERDAKAKLLALDLVRDRDRRRLDDPLDLLDDHFDLDGGDVFAVSADDILYAPMHGEKAVLVLAEQVAGAKPSVREGKSGGLGVL